MYLTLIYKQVIMVFLGYILPPENQKAYNDDVALALSNYKKDLINASLEKIPPVVQQKLIDLINIQNTTKSNLPTAIDDLTKLLNPFPPPLPPTKQPLTVRTTGSAGPTPIQSPLETKPERKMTPQEMAIASAESLLSKQLNRPLSPEEKNDISNKVTMQGRLSAEISPSLIPSPTSSTDTSPSLIPSPTSSTDTSPLTISDISTIDNIDQQLEVLRTNGASDKTIQSVVDSITQANKKNILINSIKAKKTVYGANSNAQKTKDPSKVLSLDDKGRLQFSDGKAFLEKYLPVVFRLNTSLLEGKGLRGRGMAAVNGEKNFGNFHLSLPAFRKGNLSIYRPKSNSIVISRRNMSPTLINIINEIKSTMKFNLDDYDRLKVIEQKVIDHVINLLRMDYPPKMKRALDEENWNLKQRYEILLSEINAGNGGFMVVNELKDILGKLKENKVINDRKYKLIISALE